MRNISIIAIYSCTTSLCLRTYIFDLLRNNPKNFITIYTPAKKLANEFKFHNVRVRSSKFLFKLNKSDLIVIPEWESDICKEILKMAKQQNIPTLFVQESIGNPSAGFNIDIYPTRICVWGPVAKDIYVERGISAENIIITGQPRFDCYYNLKKEKVLVGDKKVLLYAAKPMLPYAGSKEAIIQQYDIIYQACQEFGLQLVCKLHPSDNVNTYKRNGVIILEDTAVSPKNYLKGYCNNNYDPKISDMKRLGNILFSSDITTTFFSTIGLEALILGRPALFFDTMGYYKTYKISVVFMDRCSFALATNKQEFVNVLNKYLENPNADLPQREKVIFDFAYKQDGKASQRIVDTIEESL